MKTTYFKYFIGTVIRQFADKPIRSRSLKLRSGQLAYSSTRRNVRWKIISI